MFDDAEAATRKSKYAYTLEGKRSGYAHGEIHAWLAFVEKKNDEALRQMREVADTQDQGGKAEVDIPAREMLAEMLIDLKQPENARLAEDEASMEIDPNRFNGLAGAAQAAETAHQSAKANSYYAQLLKNCDGGKHTWIVRNCRARKPKWRRTGSSRTQDHGRRSQTPSRRKLRDKDGVPSKSSIGSINSLRWHQVAQFGVEFPDCPLRALNERRQLSLKCFPLGAGVIPFSVPNGESRSPHPLQPHGSVNLVAGQCRTGRPRTSVRGNACLLNRRARIWSRNIAFTSSILLIGQPESDWSGPSWEPLSMERRDPGCISSIQ